MKQGTPQTMSQIVALHMQQLSILLKPSPFNDIGTILDPTKSIETICLAVTNLSRDEKYSLLYHHIEPPNVLPCTLFRGTKRNFMLPGLKDIPGCGTVRSWMAYFVGLVHFFFLVTREGKKA